jgi:GNAT superfamily N-acetyltransferase
MSEIRYAEPADLEGLVELCERFYELDRQEFDPARVRGALATLLASPERGFVLVAGAVGAPTAYAIVTWGFAIESGGVDALLDELYVDERSRGLGSRLMERAMTEARAEGASQMFLETQAHNRRARMFYTRHGFAIDNSVWMSREL